MTDTSTIELFAEIAIGLIGFAGLVGVLARSRLPPEARQFRIRALLGNSSMALGGSLLPLVLMQHGMEAESVWLTSAVLIWVNLVLALVLAFRSAGPLLRDAKLPVGLSYFVLSLLVAVWLYLSYGIVLDRAALPGIYLTVVAAGLGLGVFHFVMLVLSIEAHQD